MRSLLVPAVLLSALCLRGPAQTTTQEPDAKAVAERAARTYQALSSFAADFHQTIADSELGTYDSRGKLVQAGTSRLSMRFSDPAGDAIVMDGQRIWVYTPSTTPGQVLRFPLPTGPTFGPNVLAWLLDKPNERYRISYVKEDSLAGRVADVIGLEPLDADLPFDRAVLWVDREDALPRRLEVRERRGTHRTLALSAIRTNGRLGEGVFKFTVPSGVRIVDQ
jgi:outer membrane lipoprotein carrier protein